MHDDGTAVITLPCVGMLPPSFVDFALSRRLADGVLLAGCAEGDCFYRLGNRWTDERMRGVRDPYLRKRVALEKLSVNWLSRDARKQRQRELNRFRGSLQGDGNA